MGTPATWRLTWAGYALGFGLGGFFDGILLHQVLQWHHLLSGLADARQDIRLLIAADGLFHVLMYLIAGLGMWLLWRARREWALPGADRSLACDVLIGFGAWHIVDAVLSHWALGIHRIRMDADVPLFWDLGWFVVFGVLPLACGWLLRRRRIEHSNRVWSSPLTLVLGVPIAGALAALPSPQQTTVMVLFRPDMSPGQSAAAIDAVGGRLVWTDPSGQLWAVDFSGGGDPTRLYFKGALVVSRSLLPVGCLSWVRA